jgi:hypothetical protein
MSQNKRTSKSRGTRAKRTPPVHIPLAFDDAMRGLLSLSAADAKAVRDIEANKKKKPK